MDRYWLLTWTTYGTWLPGDERGFVSEVNDGHGGRVIHNIPGTAHDAGWDRLEHDSRNRLKANPVYLAQKHAELIAGQLHETAEYRQWQLVCLAIMANHVHLVVGVPGGPCSREHPSRFQKLCQPRTESPRGGIGK